MMKKSLIALAVIAASGVAMAQSSVTLYGVADAGWGRTPADALAGTSSKFISSKTTNNAGSRVGLTGVEDLGNGNNAGFQFETGLSLEDGAFAGGGSSAATPWARQANVFVGGGWGTIKMGRQFTASYIANGAYDLTGQANYSVLDYTFGGYANTYTPRADSAIAYVTPNMGGFQGAIAFVSKHNSGLDKNIIDLGLWYKNGGLAVALGADKNLLVNKTKYHLGAKYDFGSFAAAAGWHSGYKGVSAGRFRGFNLGAQAKFGAFTVTLDAVRVTKNGNGGKKYTNAVLEGKYALSKRTFVYADVLRDGSPEVKKTGWGLGIRHNF